MQEEKLQLHNIKVKKSHRAVNKKKKKKRTIVVSFKYKQKILSKPRKLISNKINMNKEYSKKTLSYQKLETKNGKVPKIQGSMVLMLFHKVLLIFFYKIKTFCR